MELKATRYEIDGGIAVVTLARPKRRNAWTGRMHTEYRWILKQADENPAVRVIVVVGDQEGAAFCAGADLGALEGHSEKGRYDPGTDESIANPGFGVDPAAAGGDVLSPSGELYVQTVLAHASRGPFPDAVAAVLACFWIYAEVGKELIPKGSPDPRYQRWIDTYGDPEFAATVERVLAVVDRVGASASAAERARFQAIFAQGCRLEWMFWDAAWRQESWPIEI